MKRTARIVVADDHPLVRAGVSAALEDKDFCQVVGEAGDGTEALDVVRQCSADLLVMDLEMGRLPAAELIQSCRKAYPQLKILVLSSHTEARYIVPLRDSQLDGFVVKSEASDCLAQAVRVILGGEKWFSHEVAGALVGGRRPEEDLLNRLTPREFQVLRLMHGGLDNESIARELGLSKLTIRRYATMIYEKLGVKNRIEAMVALDTRDLAVLK